MSSNAIGIDTNYRVRETVLDTISKLDPYTRPVLASLGRKNLTGFKPEWTLQELATPSASNTNAHGFQTTFASGDYRARTQEYNYVQLLDKPVAVDKSYLAVDIAGLGIGEELQNQKRLKQTELLNDFEAMLVSANVRVAPATGTAGVAGGMQTFLTTNTVTASSNSASNANFPEDHLTYEMWSKAQSLIKKAGGMPNKAFMGIDALNAASSWVQNINRDVGNDGRALTMVIESIRGVAGLIDLVYHPQLTSTVLEIETGRFEVGWLRAPYWEDYPDGLYDVEGGVYKAEGTLISYCEKASGKITGLNYVS